MTAILNSEFTLIAFVVVAIIMVVISMFKPSKINSPQQKNAEHLEWVCSTPVLKKRVHHKHLEIKPSEIKPGYLTYAGIKG